MQRFINKMPKIPRLVTLSLHDTPTKVFKISGSHPQCEQTPMYSALELGSEGKGNSESSLVKIKIILTYNKQIILYIYIYIYI